MQEIEISWWLFELCTCKIGQPIQPIWQQFFALPWSALKKPLWEFNFLHIFAVSMSSMHEKCCQILERLYVVFHHSRNILCGAHSIYYGDNFLNHKTSIHTFNSTPLFSFSWFAHLAQLQPWGAGVVQLTARQYIVEYLVLLFQTAKSGKNAAVYFGLKQTYF